MSQNAKRPSFPHSVDDNLTGRSVRLYAEPGRASVTYRVIERNGNRSRKKAVPKSLPAAARKIPEDGLLPDELLDWANRLLLKSSARTTSKGRRPSPERTNHVRLGHVFQRVREGEWYKNLSKKRREEIDLCMRWVESVLGPEFLLSTWDEDTLLKLDRVRREKGVRTVDADSKPVFLAPADRNTAAKDIKNLKTVFKKATRLKWAPGVTDWLLDANPLERSDLPKAGVRKRRTLVGQARFEILMDHADEVDPTGRFRFFLVIARWTGRRISTIRRMTRSVILESEHEILRALQEQLCDYVDVMERERIAALYMKQCGGAFFIRWSMVKPGQSGDEDKVEQYDAVFPVHPVVVQEWKRYRERYWDRLGLAADAPLFPGKTLNKAVSGETVNDWFKDAMLLAAENGRPLRLAKGNKWHGFRANRRTEYRHVHDKYGRWLVGHSIRSGTPGISVSEGRYLGLVPEDLVKAVMLGDGHQGEEE